MGKLNVIAEPGTYEILMTRDFNAPRELVFKALCDPKLIPQWWGPGKYKTVVDQMDVRKGGIWRYVQRDDDGNEWAFHGVYHDISAPDRMVYTFEFEGMPGHVLMETVTFEEHDGKTRLTDSAVFQSVADRDGMLQSGMESGASEGWDRFDEVLKTM
jgi:uncharacterized protein YndB with AHSA1/START domain